MTSQTSERNLGGWFGLESLKRLFGLNESRHSTIDFHRIGGRYLPETESKKLPLHAALHSRDCIKLQSPSRLAERGVRSREPRIDIRV